MFSILFGSKQNPAQKECTEQLLHKTCHSLCNMLRQSNYNYNQICTMFDYIQFIKEYMLLLNKNSHSYDKYVFKIVNDHLKITACK